MAINVAFSAFAKKPNSTAVPSSAAVTFSCELKEGCSVLTPVVGINNGAAWNPASYNYAQISAFHRYYYVTDWEYSGGLWWATLSVDVLATWKASILSNTLYVARAYRQYDGSIGDTLFPAKCEFENSTNSFWNSVFNSPWVPNFYSGFYMVGIINNDSSSVGAVSYYAFTQAQFEAFKAAVLTDTTWTGIATTNPDLGDNLYRSLFNPIQYIASVMWFPFAFQASWGTAITGFNFGWWHLDTLSCTRITTYTVQFSSALNVPAHPQAVYRGKYLNASPYSKYRLFAPPFGEFELDGTMLHDNYYNASHITTINCYIHVDLITGEGVLTVITNPATQGNEGKTMLLAQARVGVSMQLAQITSDHMGQLRNIIDTASGTVSSLVHGDVGGVISSVGNGVLNAVENTVPHPASIGSNGSIAIYAQQFRLECLYYVMVADAHEELGRPLCQEKQLSELSPGYVKTVGAHVAIGGFESEIDSINTFLDNGVFLE